MRTSVFVLFLLAGIGGSQKAQAQDTWVQQPPTASPQARDGAPLAFDSLHQRIVLFGGATLSGTTPLLGDTWLWDGTNWTLASTTGPSPRAYFAFAYDELHQQAVLFGGLTSSARVNETWVWDGTTWTQMAPATSPPARSHATMAYDAATQRVILFGGESASFTCLSDTWAWDGTNWTQLSPATVPKGNCYNASAYDAALQQVVLVIQSAGSNQTWTWNGIDWTQHAPPTNLSQRTQLLQMAYDGGRQRTIAFGGFAALAVAGSNFLNDTWTWDGSTWNQLAPVTSPPVRSYSGIAYDPIRQQTVIFGGLGQSSTGSQTVLNDTWTLGSGTAQTPVTINVPAGLQFTFNGTAYTGSQTINIAPGTYALSTASPQSTGAGSQAVFVSWSDGGGLSHQVVVGPSSISITGTFQTQYYLTTSASPAAGGSVSPPSGYFDAGTVVGVTASANLGYAFGSWSGACSGSSTCSVPMNAPASVTGNFTATGISVTITVPPGVQFSLNGVTYTGSQSISLPAGNYPLSTVSPQSMGLGTQAVFVSWSDGGAQSHPVSVGSSSISITGTFKTQYYLMTLASPAAGGSVSPTSGYFDAGTAIAVTATASPGYAFSSWSGACSGSSTCSVPMNAPASVTGNFTLIVVPLIVTVPAGVQFSLNGATYTGSQTLTVPPGSYSLSTLSPQLTGFGTRAVWVSWSDGGAQSHQITAPGAVTGTYSTQYFLFTAAAPAAGGTVTPGGYYDAGSAVVVTATPNPGFGFNYWTGACSGSAASCLVVMNSVQEVTANFGPAQNWVQLFPRKSPPPRVGYAMAFDAAHHQVVLFGGVQSDGTLLGDTWVWDGAMWTKMTPPVSPPARVAAMITYDEARGEVVLFGGANGGGQVVALNDTWVWNGNTWTQKAAAGPPAREGGGMSYDAAHQQVILFGGENPLSQRFFGDTWIWDGAAWTLRAPANSPSQRFPGAMTYDPVRQRTVMFGGVFFSSAYYDAWEWDGANWSQKPAIQHPAAYSGAMAYNPASRQTLFFGSDGTTWGWDGSVWLQKMPVTSPAARATNAVYDAAHQEILLFGGVDTATNRYYNDTWAWLTPVISLVPEPPTVTTSGGNFVVTLPLANFGNVPDTIVILDAATLGSATSNSQFVGLINPGTTGSVSVKFKATSKAGTVTTATFQGTYSADGVNGIPWSASFQVVLP